jgi:ABC-2 type transport system permease protein
MRLIFEIGKRSFQRTLAYRAAAIAGVITNLFFGLLRIAVLVALYGQRTEVTGLSVQDAVTFTGLTQAIISFLALFGWYEVMLSIYTGTVAGELLKPVSYYRYWAAHDLGRAAAQLIMRGLPIMLVYAVFFDITIPRTLAGWAAFAAALLLAWWVSFSWRLLVNLTAFWVPNAQGIGRFAFILSWFLSGFLMPLRFFPDWFIQLCYLTPFPHAINAVVETYLGVLSGPEIAATLLGQAAWGMALTLACTYAMKAGVRRLVIQGG